MASSGALFQFNLASQAERLKMFLQARDFSQEREENLVEIGKSIDRVLNPGTELIELQEKANTFTKVADNIDELLHSNSDSLVKATIKFLISESIDELYEEPNMSSYVAKVFRNPLASLCKSICGFLSQPSSLSDGGKVDLFIKVAENIDKLMSSLGGCMEFNTKKFLAHEGIDHLYEALDISLYVRKIFDNPGVVTHCCFSHAALANKSRSLFFKRLLEECKDDSASKAAVHSGQVWALKLLQELGIGSFIEDGEWATALYCAGEDRCVEMVEYLLQEGVCADKLMLRAVESGQLAAVKRLKEAGVNLEVVDHMKGQTFLHGAARSGHLQIVQYLVEEGVNKYVLDKKGRTPLVVAMDIMAETTSNRMDIIRFFGRDKDLIEVEDIYGETALHRAAGITTYPDIIRCFIAEGGVDPNIKSKKTGETAVHRAVKYKRSALSTLEILSEAGAHLNEKDNRGQTPLHLAARNGAIAIIAFFIRNRVDPEAVNERGEIADHFKTCISSIRERTFYSRASQGGFRKILDDLDFLESQRSGNFRSHLPGYDLTPEVKGSIVEDNHVGGIMYVSRSRVGSLRQYIYEMVLGFEQLSEASEVLCAINNRQNFFSNPAAQLAHAVSGLTFHVEIAGKNKDLFGHGPKLLLEAYQLAREKDDLKNFFNVAFNKNNVCIDPRLNLLSDYIERNRLGFDPDLRLKGKEMLQGSSTIT